MFTIKGCSLIRGVHYERFHCTSKLFFSRSMFWYYRYSKCHISGNNINVDGVEVSDVVLLRMCSIRICNKMRICFYRPATHFGMCGHI